MTKFEQRLIEARVGMTSYRRITLRGKTVTRLFWLSCLFVASLPAAEAGAQVVPRHILALYDTGRGQTSIRNQIHINAEAILNHLGCVVDYWDIATGLPDDARMRPYRGVLTWFYGETIPEPEKYLKWAERQLDAGRRLVILGDIAAFRDRASSRAVPLAKVNHLLKRIGFVAGGGQWTADPLKIEPVRKESDMVEFERTLDYELNSYSSYKATAPDARVYLTIRRNDIENSDSDVVLTSPAGGFAAASYVLYENPETNSRQWRINPFRFFEEAFGLEGLPRPDVTTRGGLRIWMSHIDGDAIISRSRTRRDAYCGDVIRDDIIRRYHWPISVSVVVAEVERSDDFIEMARSVFAFDWVEAASHSYAHPFYWASDSANKKDYDRQHLPIPGYKFNLNKEISGSVAFINKRLLPPGKKVRTFFWTGDCEPTAKAIKLCSAAGVLNVNGGDTVFDRLHPSYTRVSSLSASVGNQRQIYAPAANENIFTNEWKGPYFGFNSVLETFQRTGAPVRIKPIDIYYHFYSGERQASLKALQNVMRETTKQEVAPMFMSDYLRIVDGFFSAKIEKHGNAWKVSDFGACRTLRFDKTGRSPDLERSRNILGFRHDLGNLYVHLGAERTAEIVLSDTPAERVYFERASHPVEKLTVSGKKIAFSTSGYGNALFVICNLGATKPFAVTFDNSEEVLRSDEEGRLRLARPISGRLRVRVEPAE